MAMIHARASPALVLCLLLLAFDTSLTSVSALTLQTHARAASKGVDMDDIPAVTAHEAKIDEYEANQTAMNGNNPFKSSRDQIAVCVCAFTVVATLMIMIPTYFDLWFTPSCRTINTQEFPELEEVQKMHSAKIESEHLYFGDVLSRFIMQIHYNVDRESGEDGQGVGENEVRLYPWHPAIKNAPGSLVLMVHESHKDDHVEQDSPRSGIKARPSGLMVAIGPTNLGDNNATCREFTRNDDLMYDLYNVANEGGGQFSRALDETIETVRTSPGSNDPVPHPASIVYLQPLEGLEYCKSTRDHYMYIAKSCGHDGDRDQDRIKDTFHTSKEDSTEEEILVWKNEVRAMYDANPTSKMVKRINNPKTGTVDLNPIIIRAHKYYKQHMVQIIGSIAILGLHTYVMSYMGIKDLTFLGQPIHLNTLFGRYHSKPSDKLTIESFDWLLVLALVVPIVGCIFFGLASRMMIRFSRSKAFAEGAVKAIVIALSLSMSLFAFCFASQLDGRYGMELARRELMLGYVDQFLALAFFFDSLIRVGREMAGMVIKPILSDSGQALMLGLMGMLDSTFGFIGAARGGHANGGQCKFKALQEALTNQVLAKHPITSYKFELQCDVVGGEFTDTDGTTYPLFDATVAGITGMHHTYDMSHCLLTCEERSASARARSTIIQCRDDGIIGCQWYTFFDTSVVCPPRGGTPVAIATPATPPAAVATPVKFAPPWLDTIAAAVTDTVTAGGASVTAATGVDSVTGLDLR